MYVFIVRSKRAWICGFVHLDFMICVLCVLKGGWHLTSFCSLTRSLFPSLSLFPCFSPPPVCVKCQTHELCIPCLVTHLCWVRQWQSTQCMSVCSNTKCIRWKPAYYKSFQKWRYTTHKVISSVLLRELAYILHHLVYTDNTSFQSQGKNCESRNRVLVTVGEVQNVFALPLQSNIYLLNNHKHYKTQKPSECCQYWHTCSLWEILHL